MRDSTYKYLRLAKAPNIWCPGCGHGIILGALTRTFHKLEINRENLVVVSGIGCSSRTPGYLDCCTLHTTHGRALSFATGIKHARPELRVVAIMGDGDATAIGGNHFIHAARRNIGVTAIVYNNNIYGMTGGQYSPTTPQGAIATTAPYGHVERGFDIAKLAEAAGASYAARTTVYHVAQMEKLLEEALQHQGFSVLEVMCHCHTTFGRKQKDRKLRTGWENLVYLKESAVPVQAAAKLGPDKMKGKFVTGVLFDDPERPEYTEQYKIIEGKARAVAEAERGRRAEGEPACFTPPVKRRWELCLSGSGGQGLLLAGVVMAEAAGKYSGLNAIQTQSYGPEARGGASKSEVVIDTAEINYPKVGTADVLVALTEESYVKYRPGVKPGGMVIVDSSVREEAAEVTPGEVVFHQLPIIKTAREDIGRVQTTNIVSLGALNELAGILAPEAMERAVLGSVPKGTEEMNKRALEAGRALGRAARGA